MSLRLSLQCSASQASFVTRLTWENYRGKNWPELWAEAFMNMLPLMIRTCIEQQAPVDEITLHFCIDRCIEPALVTAHMLAGDQIVNEIVNVLPEPTAKA